MSKISKLLAALLLIGTSTVALAGGYYHDGDYYVGAGNPHGYYGGHRGGYGHGGYGYGGHHRGGGDWIAPAIIGGVIGYAIAQPRVYQQPQVIYQQPSVVQQNCTAWIETVDAYGNITRTRTCY